MAATFLTLRFGSLNDDGLRRSTFRFSYPLWVIDRPLRRVQRERILKVEVEDGSVTDSLGLDPVTFSLGLELRPSEQPLARAQEILNRVRRLTGQPLQVEIGGDDWGDGWRLQDLQEEYRKFNLPTDTGGIVDRTDGGMEIAVAGVEFTLVRGVTGRATVVTAPPPPVNVVI